MINLPPAPNYDYKYAGAIYPATGILLIGAIMKNRGLAVRVIDCAIKSDYVAEVLGSIDMDTIMAGFSVMTSQVPMALALSNSIKSKYPAIPIIWGGIHPILFPEQTASNPSIDIVVTGEGAKTTSDLIDYLSGKIGIRDIAGIGFKDIAGKVVLTGKGDPDNINEIPYFDYSILDNSEIYLGANSVYKREIATDDNEKLRIMPVLTGLGCCYRCRFCINVFLKRRYRFRTGVSIIEEIKRLQDRYNANAFVLYDEDFLISKRRLLEFLDLIEKERLKFYWRIWGRVDYFRDDYLDRELVLRMERNGLRSIAMGAESGSQKILDLIEKDIKVEDIPRSARLLNGTRITPRYSFMVGLDGERERDIFRTYELCSDLITINRKTDIAGPFIFRYYPGSPIFDEIVKKNNMAMPKKLEDWEEALSEEGYLKAGNMLWTWSGFAETIKFLNNELQLFSKLRNMNNFIGIFLRKLIGWRFRNTYREFPVELYIFNMMKVAYHKYLRIMRVSVEN